MRPLFVLALAGLLLPPLAAAHEDDRVFRLEVPAGPAAGPVLLHLHDAHRLLGIGVGGCALGSAGALRIATPTGGAIEVTLNGLGSCTGSSTNAAGADASRLDPGSYPGAYAFELAAPLVIEIYAEG